MDVTIKELMKKSALWIVVVSALAGCGGNQPNSNVGGTNYTPQPGRGAAETAALAFITKGSGAKAVTAANSFGLKLLQEAVKTEKGGNVLISPLSASTALLMAYNGANGDTKAEMAKALQLDKLKPQDLNAAAKAVLEMLQQPSEKTELKIANSLWAARGVEFKDEFLKVNRSYYNAHLGAADLATKEGVEAVNKWISERTSSKIKKLLDDSERGRDAVLVNAVYFKGQWQSAFDPEKTQSLDFHPAVGDAKKVPMMTRAGQMSYLKDKTFDAVRLPYGTGQMAMYVLVPSGEMDGFLKDLTAANWSKWIEDFKPGAVSVTMPRFKQEFSLSLVAALKTLGMAEAFTPKADFKALSATPLSISDVKHGTFVQVDEEGTEAAAATAVEMTKGIPEYALKLVADKPFLYVIADEQTKTILFLGLYSKPG